MFIFATFRIQSSAQKRVAMLVSCFHRAVIGCDTVAGGDEGNRTLDPLLAGQVLSQLSYTPICAFALGFVEETILKN